MNLWRKVLEPARRDVHKLYLKLRNDIDFRTSQSPLFPVSPS